MEMKKVNFLCPLSLRLVYSVVRAVRPAHKQENEMTTTQTRSEAVEMIVDVLADGNRSDRYLRQAEDGHYFTTSDLSNDGPYTPPSVKIPVSYDGTEDEDRDWAESLLDQLIKLIETEQ